MTKYTYHCERSTRKERSDAMSKQPTALEKFVVESWRIEGLLVSGAKLCDLIYFHKEFLKKELLLPDDTVRAASVFTEGYGQLRNRPGLNVRVGNHIAPPGGPEIYEQLKQLCADAYTLSPYELHQRFEQLHPFIDGNGRTGRLVWLWRMNDTDQPAHLGFLHTWYYQSLENYRPILEKSPPHP